jgi:uncharacterized protein (DUF305 family)
MHWKHHLVIVSFAALAAGCGSTPSTLNEADVEFLQGMIPHHQQAVEMAELVEPSTDRAELRQLAGDVISTQSAEVELMTGLLEEAGEDVPDADMSGMDHGAEPMMGGMMTDEQMGAMRGASGVEFDVVWAESMIAHHQGAIEAAESVLEEGAAAEVRALAEAVIEAQTSEIAQLTAWLDEWR